MYIKCKKNQHNLAWRYQNIFLSLKISPKKLMKVICFIVYLAFQQQTNYKTCKLHRSLGGLFKDKMF